MTKSGEDVKRMRFEEHLKDRMPNMSLERCSYDADEEVRQRGDYVDNDTEWMWNGWQAAWSACAQECAANLKRLMAEFDPQTVDVCAAACERIGKGEA